MKVFLTGGTGFIGAPLTRELLRRGWTVTVLSRSGRSPAPGAQGVQGDLADLAGLRAAMTGADLVIHNAGWYELGLPAAKRLRMRAVNVDGTRNVLALARELKTPRVVYTSTTTALGDTGGQVVDESFQRQALASSYYEETKAEAHVLALQAQAEGLPLIIACPAQVIGPGDHSAFGWFARLYVRGLLPPIIWAPEGAFTFGHVDDVAEGLALAAEKGRAGQTYYLAGREPTTLRKLMPVWKAAVGGLPPFIWLPRPLAAAQGALAEPVLRLLGLPAFISREVVRASFVSFQYSSARAERDLGWQPRTAGQTWIDTLRAERDLARRGAAA
jgi:dihydroflavonol-4-reductase